MLTPRIYVASLSDYNNSRLHGVWIDADQDPDDITYDINEMLTNSTEDDAEEYAIHDYDDFCNITINEYESLKTVSDLANAIIKYGEAFGAYVSYKGTHGIDSLINDFEESFRGKYDSEKDYAKQSIAELYEIPEFLENYIDYKAWARDLFMTDYFSREANQGVYVFSVC